MSFSPRRFNAENRCEQARASAGGSVLYKTSVNSFRPVWGDGYFVFRAFPALSVEDPTVFDPMYLPSGAAGEWFYQDFVANYVGTDMPVSFFLRNNDFDKSLDFVRNPCPYSVLYDAVKRTEQLPPQERKWVDLLRGASGVGAKLPAYKAEHMFIQGIVYHKGMKDYSVDASLEKLSVIHLPYSAGRALKHELDIVRANNPRLDLTALDQSNFITVWNGSAMHPYTQEVSNADSKTYRVSIDDTYRGYGPYQHSQCILTHKEAEVRAVIKPWVDVLNFMTYEEQAELLSRAFRSQPDMLLYAWTDYPEWVSEDVRRRGADIRVGNMQYQPSAASAFMYPTGAQPVYPGYNPQVTQPDMRWPAAGDPLPQGNPQQRPAQSVWKTATAVTSGAPVVSKPAVSDPQQNLTQSVWKTAAMTPAADSSDPVDEAPEPTTAPW